MSETQNQETAPAETTNQPKKKSKLFLIVGLLVILLAGGAGGYYFYAKAGSAEAAGNDEADSKTKGKKSSSKDDEEESDGADEKDSKKDSLKSSLPDDEDVKSVVEIPPFIVNLADSDSPRYLRMTVSLGIGGEDGAEAKPEPLFLTRVKNAMLAVLTTKSSEDVLSAEGKTKLRKELLKAAQAASEEPHVEAIYITDFIVQL